MTCRHENIFWEDFFKEPKKNKAYCLDCSADKGKPIASAIKIWYVEKVKEWLRKNKLTKIYVLNGEEIHSYNDFEEFVDKNNYKKQWDDLNFGSIENIDSNYFGGFGGQAIFFEYARSIEYLCKEFKKEKEKDDPNERERERESKLGRKLRD